MRRSEHLGIEVREEGELESVGEEIRYRQKLVDRWTGCCIVLPAEHALRGLRPWTEGHSEIRGIKHHAVEWGLARSRKADVLARDQIRVHWPSVLPVRCLAPACSVILRRKKGMIRWEAHLDLARLGHRTERQRRNIITVF